MASGSMRNFPFSSQYTSLTGRAGPTSPEAEAGPGDGESPALGIGLGIGSGFGGSDFGEEEEEEVVPPLRPNICNIFLAFFLSFLGVFFGL